MCSIKLFAFFCQLERARLNQTGSGATEEDVLHRWPSYAALDSLFGRNPVLQKDSDVLSELGAAAKADDTIDMTKDAVAV